MSAVIQTLGEAKLKVTRCSEPDGWWRIEIDSDQSACVLVCPSRMRELIGDLMKDDDLRSVMVARSTRSSSSGVMG